MKNFTKRGTIMAAMLLAWACIPAMAQNTGGNTKPSFDIGLRGGVSGCVLTVHKVRDNWFDLKHRMAPDGKGLKPAVREFACVSPMIARESAEISVPATMGLRCFSYYDGQVFCCNESLSECATKPQ